jgi:adenosine kinase
MGWDLGKDHVKIVAKIGEYPFAEGITGTRKVVITRADDVVVANGSEVALFGVEKLPKEEMVDANGAGDAFCGGFIAAMMKAKGDDIAVKAGVYAAQVIIRTSGTKLPTDAPKFAF